MSIDQFCFELGQRSRPGDWTITRHGLIRWRARNQYRNGFTPCPLVWLAQKMGKTYDILFNDKYQTAGELLGLNKKSTDIISRTADGCPHEFAAELLKACHITKVVA